MSKILRIGSVMIIALVIVFNSAIVFSESGMDLPTVESKSAENEYSDISIYLDNKSDNKALDLSTDDVVTVQPDGIINIVSKGVSLTITPPFGWIVLTQDVFAQLDTYMMITDDIEGLLGAIKRRGAQAYCFDCMSDSSVVFRVEDDSLAKLFSNISNIAEAYMPSLLTALKGSYDADDASVVEAGNNMFIRLAGHTEEMEYIVFITYFNDKAVSIVCNSDGSNFSDFELETFDTLLTDLAIS